MVSIVPGATYAWLITHTAEIYSKYDPPELKGFADFVALSSFLKSCDFLLFQARALGTHAQMHNPRK